MDLELCPSCDQNVPTVRPTADRPGVDEDGLPFFDYHQRFGKIGNGPPMWHRCPRSGRTTADD